MNSPTQPWLMENGTTTATEPTTTTTTTTTLPSPSVGRFSGIFNIVATRPVAFLRRIWTNYYPRGAFGEDGVTMPGSPLCFVISGLLSFIEIKSQGQPEFPFQTHPLAIMVAITSLLMYGLSSGAQQLISDASNSVYAIIARLGKTVQKL